MPVTPTSARTTVMPNDEKPERVRLLNHGDLDVEFDHETNSVWAFMNHKGRPCFSLSMMKNVRDHDATLESTDCKVAIDGVQHTVDCYVGASRLPGVYNLGGDLSLFLLLIKARDREALSHYARLCIDCLWARIINFGSRHLTTISLVQGDALGGGFESVLASDVIIAEEQSRLGFPEVMFNLFPGMGAQSLLTRRIGAQRAEELIFSGRLIGAQELQAMGIVDVVAQEGQGEKAVKDFILSNQKRLNTLRSIHHCRQIVNPVTRDELDAIADVWVEAALRLNDRDLKLMGRVVRSQLKLIENTQSV